MSNGVSGRYLNIQTEEEATAFLRNAQRDGSFELFSSILKTVTIIRKREKKKKKLNLMDRKTLLSIYFALSRLVNFSEKQLFRAVVPEKEIAAWFDHTADILQQKINDAHWIRNGALLEHDHWLLVSYVELVKHPLPVVMTYEDTKILEIISSMIISRKGASDLLPQEKFTEPLYMILEGLMACGVIGFDNTWTVERVLKKLEVTSIVEQFLRCATIQSTKEHYRKFKTNVLMILMYSPTFVRKRLKKGTACGDTLRAILTRRECPVDICSEVLPWMQSLEKFSTVLQIKDNNQCCRCGSRDAYMQCGRCQESHYCSKECQKAHWKQHKMICIEIPDDMTISTLSRKAIATGLRGIYVEIMSRLVEECDNSGGLKMNEMILELNFSPDECGRIPMFQDPPQFQIVPVARYLDGTRITELLERAGNRGPPHISAECFVEKLNHQLSAESSSGLLCFELQPTLWAYRFHQLAFEDREVFTQEAVDAFRIALVDGDYSGLFPAFESHELCQAISHLIRGLRDTGRTS